MKVMQLQSLLKNIWRYIKNRENLKYEKNNVSLWDQTRSNKNVSISK